MRKKEAKKMFEDNATRLGIAPTLNNTVGDLPQPEITPYALFTIVIGILAVFLNGLLLIAMLRNASTIFTSHEAYLVANMAVADLVTGLNSLMWGLTNTFLLSKILRKVIFSLFWTSIEVSFLTIFVMSLERYIAIIFPFAACVWLSRSRTIQSCVLVWVLSCLCGACMAFYREIVSFCLMLIFEITILVTTFLYYKIFIKLRQRRACFPSQLNVAGARSNIELKREYQLTTVVVALTCTLIITVLPYMVGGQIALVNQMFSAPADYPDLQIFLHYYLPIELMNFVLNPIVYAWRLPKYRYALLRTLQLR